MHIWKEDTVSVQEIISRSIFCGKQKREAVDNPEKVANKLLD